MKSLFTLAVTLLVLSGCAISKTYKVARYREGAEPVSQLVPSTNFYAVSYVDAHGNRHVLKYTARVLAKGSTVGFRTSPDGVVYAYTPREMFAVAAPRDVVLMWRGSEEKERGFVREFHKNADSFGDDIGGISSHQSWSPAMNSNDVSAEKAIKSIRPKVSADVSDDASVTNARVQSSTTIGK